MRTFHVLSFVILFCACGDNTGIGGQGADASSAPPTDTIVDASVMPSLPDATTMDQPDATTMDQPDASPNTPSPIPIPELACSFEEVQPILACAAEKCLSDIGKDSLPLCLGINCGLLLLNIPQECRVCILQGIVNPSEILDVCVEGLPTIP